MPNIRKIQRRIAEKQARKNEVAKYGLKQDVRKGPMVQGLFLDDERNPEEVIWCRYDNNIRWTIVRTPSEFLAAIAEKDFPVYSFDYYLGGRYVQDAGLEMLKKLDEKWHKTPPKEIPHMYFHSQHQHESGDRMKNGARVMERFWLEMFDRLYDQEQERATNPVACNVVTVKQS